MQSRCALADGLHQNQNCSKTLTRGWFRPITEAQKPRISRMAWRMGNPSVAHEAWRRDASSRSESATGLGRQCVGEEDASETDGEAACLVELCAAGSWRRPLSCETATAEAGAWYYFLTEK